MAHFIIENLVSDEIGVLVIGPLLSRQGLLSEEFGACSGRSLHEGIWSFAIAIDCHSERSPLRASEESLRSSTRTRAILHRSSSGWQGKNVWTGIKRIIGWTRIRIVKIYEPVPLVKVILKSDESWCRQLRFLVTR